ncbi:MAG TPA: c-type cytochrome [Bryobacteraceae bacterium]|nr:c-type cytochrome [Bryobacteraceae bacterium]
MWTLTRACSLILIAGAMYAQHSYTPADVEDGGRLFRGNCVGCHGTEGNLVPGIDLGHGKFKRASTDEDLVNIIRSGIPGTPMPPGNYTEFQASTIVAYLRSLANTGRGSGLSGDSARGRALFAGKGACETCHRVGSEGSRVGPDLTDIGTLRKPPALEASIVNPDAEILAQNRYYRVVTKDGATVTGRLLNRDTFSVQLLDTKEQIRSFLLANVREHGFVEKSPMPSYKDKLTAQEVADVVSYLGTLKGIDSK